MLKHWAILGNPSGMFFIGGGTAERAGTKVLRRSVVTLLPSTAELPFSTEQIADPKCFNVAIDEDRIIFFGRCRLARCCSTVFVVDSALACGRSGGYLFLDFVCGYADFECPKLVMTGASLYCVVTLFASDAAFGEDSRQWGGNDLGRNMYSPEMNLPTKFTPGKLRKNSEEFDPASAKNVKWSAKIGSQSFSSPAISGGKVFIGTNNDSPRNPREQGDRSILMCFEEQSGKFLWQLVVPKLAAGKVNDWENLGLTITPAVEENRVYLSTSRGEVLCLTTEGLGAGNVGPYVDEAHYIAGPGHPPVKTTEMDADIVWRYDMIEELGVFPHNNTRSQVLLIGDNLYLTTCNGQDWTHSNIPSPAAPSLIVLNKRTGELVAVDHAEISRKIFHGQWSGPSGGKIHGRQLIFYGGGDGFCYAFDAQTERDGDEQILPVVWSMDCNPMKYRYKLGVDLFTPIRYPRPEGPSEIVGSPVFWRNRVYVAIGQDPEHGEGLGNLVCLDATKFREAKGGNVLWESDKIARSMSTPAITPDGLLFITDFTGVLYCFDAFFGQLFWKRDLGTCLVFSIRGGREGLYWK